MSEREFFTYDLRIENEPAAKISLVYDLVDNNITIKVLYKTKINNLTRYVVFWEENIEYTTDLIEITNAIDKAYKIAMNNVEKYNNLYDVLKNVNRIEFTD